VSEPRPLPLTTRAGLLGLACRFKCGDACAGPAPNPSANPYFGELLHRPLGRRAVLRAGAVLTLAGAAGPALAACSGATTPGPNGPGPETPAGLRFEPVAPNTADALRLPPGYAHNVVIRWGDPVVPGAPAFDFGAQSAAAQSMQFGYNNDFVALVALPGDDRRHVMVVNHEYTIEPMMFRGYDAAAPTEEQIRIGLAAHGLSVVVVAHDPVTGRMSPELDPRYNRRITGTTPIAVDGPAAGSRLLRTSADPTGRAVLGTLNNCSGGLTPWGTVLSGEENINQYFGGTVADPVAAARAARYGIGGKPTERDWERLDPRFDLAREPNEANRFGWVVEVDPLDPGSTPVKHTALGRFKHEGASVRLAGDGRAVVYLGDDERFDYVYKFVSEGRVAPGESRAVREANRALLSTGTLYVARFSGDRAVDGTGTLPAGERFAGTGTWIRLMSGTTSFVDGMSVEEVAVFTRLAADRVGATKMDRPEDIEANPRTGHVYLAMTNNTDRGRAGRTAPDEANPRTANRNGHVIELVETGGEAAAESFDWSILLLAGDPKDPGTWFGGFDKSQVSPISSPDNLTFDPHGNLWIATDSGAELGFNDGLYGVALDGPARGRTTLFASVPVGAECCGPNVTEEFALLAVQHPGDVSQANADAPGSAWPDGPGTQPRPAVVNIWRVTDSGGPGRIGT